MHRARDFKAFIIVDDDPISIFICRQLVELRAGQPVPVFDFTMPEQALCHIKDTYSSGKAVKTLMFLDVNTETLSAWDFLEKFDALEDLVKKAFSIYIISSSVDEGDRERALGNKYVSGYLVKPLSIESVGEII